MGILSRAAGLALGALLLLGPAIAQEPVWRTGISLIETPKFPDGFAHYDFVNPEAPKGGTVRLSTMGSFDTLNPILPQGEPAIGLGLVYEMLMDSSLGEPSTMYGHIASALSWPDDYSSVTFKLNPKAKWQDGQPITAEDVIWSFEKQKELNPSIANYYHNVTKAEKTADDQVTFTFDQTGNRELPSIMGQLTVLPKHWWEGTGADGKPRDIGASTMELPMGSGPYKLKSFTPGQTIIYERDPNYWAQNEPTGIGMNNFDEIRYEFFRDLDVAFEAFKGDQFDWWEENRAKRWATAYDFPAVKEKRVIQELFENNYRDNGVMVGFVLNLRKPQFQDPRVRRALNYLFDFEALNQTIFYNQYDRISSYFFGTELASSGLPEGEELEILNSVKDKIPASVFTEPYTNPVGGDATKRRENQRRAVALLAEAGYTLNDQQQMVDANGQQLSFEILLDGPTIEPVATPYAKAMQDIGINATVRIADSAQYTNRVRSFDYDAIYSGWAQTLSPGNEQRDFWGSQAANKEDTRNYAGIADPGVDALIDKIIYADDRQTLIAATHALDRVLLANSYIVPSYTLRKSRVARWDRFSHPDTLPEYNIGFPTVWWWDSEKAKVTGGANQ